MMTEQTYLGDGVYARFDGYHVVLTTGPSKNPTFLDQTVWQALVDYGKRAFGSPVKETLYGNCSVCGEPIAVVTVEVHTDFDGYSCHAACCPVCHGGEPPYGA